MQGELIWIKFAIDAVSLWVSPGQRGVILEMAKRITAMNVIAS